MRWSTLFIPTLRENPAEGGSVSHQLLVRAGYTRQRAPGVFSYLTLGQRSVLKIVRIVREEMEAIGAQEMQFPVLHPAAEIIASIAQGELRSYRQLPQIWYQIQGKLDGEARSKAELLRNHRSLAVESYSFDAGQAGQEISYQKHCDAWSKVFARCGLRYVVAEARGGAIFMAASEAGEDDNSALCWVRLRGAHGEGCIARYSRRLWPTLRATTRRSRFIRRAARQSRTSPNSPAYRKRRK